MNKLISCSFPEHLRRTSFVGYPVVKSPDGTNFLCMMVLKSTMTSPGVIWYVFGVINEIESVSDNVTDFILYGYVQGLSEDTSRLGTFGFRNIVDLDALVYLKPDKIRRACPPRGWTLVTEEELFLT